MVQTQPPGCGLLGFVIGYWAIFVTVAAELFGTNLRATEATSVPNFVRGSSSRPVNRWGSRPAP